MPSPPLGVGMLRAVACGLALPPAASATLRTARIGRPAAAITKEAGFAVEMADARAQIARRHFVLTNLAGAMARGTSAGGQCTIGDRGHSLLHCFPQRGNCSSRFRRRSDRRNKIGAGPISHRRHLLRIRWPSRDRARRCHASRATGFGSARPLGHGPLRES